MMLFLATTPFAQVQEGAYGCFADPASSSLADGATDVAPDEAVQFGFEVDACPEREFRFTLFAGGAEVEAVTREVPVGTFRLELPMEPDTAYELVLERVVSGDTAIYAFRTAAAAEPADESEAAGCAAAGMLPLGLVLAGVARRRRA